MFDMRFYSYRHTTLGVVRIKSSYDYDAILSSSPRPTLEIPMTPSSPASRFLSTTGIALALMVLAVSGALTVGDRSAQLVTDATATFYGATGATH